MQFLKQINVSSSSSSGAEIWTHDPLNTSRLP